ncbi:MAG: hypothetical protein LC722_01010 [Actinobacteria bacterium]|nr:hypothetical protein [Actinomycetota bacterium]
MSLFDDVAEKVYDGYEDVKAYLATDEGRELRRKLAAGLMFSAPLISRLPIMRASKIGKVVGLAGGAALLVKAAEMIRDWEPIPAQDPNIG